MPKTAATKRYVAIMEGEGPGTSRPILATADPDTVRRVCDLHPGAGPVAADPDSGRREGRGMSDTATPLPRLLTAREVSEQTGLPLSRVYELTRSGDLPHTRFGRACRYSAPALREFIESGGTGEWSAPDAGAA